MSLELIAKNREDADVYQGADKCKKKFWELMEGLNLPKGLVPLDDEVTELGHNKATGFMWIIRNNRKEHVFKGLGGKVYFDTEVTAVLEDRKMKQVHGVKSKELFITFTIREIYIMILLQEKLLLALLLGSRKRSHVLLLNLKNRTRNKEQ